MFRDPLDSLVVTGGPGGMNHPEYVVARGTSFLSTWGEQSLRDQIEVAERAMRDIADGRIADQDAPVFAARARREIRRVKRF